MREVLFCVDYLPPSLGQPLICKLEWTLVIDFTNSGHICCRLKANKEADPKLMSLISFRRLIGHYFSFEPHTILSKNQIISTFHFNSGNTIPNALFIIKFTIKNQNPFKFDIIYSLPNM